MLLFGWLRSIRASIVLSFLINKWFHPISHNYFLTLGGKLSFYWFILKILPTRRRQRVNELIKVVAGPSKTNSLTFYCEFIVCFLLSSISNITSKRRRVIDFIKLNEKREVELWCLKRSWVIQLKESKVVCSLFKLDWTAVFAWLRGAAAPITKPFRPHSLWEWKRKRAKREGNPKTANETKEF